MRVVTGKNVALSVGMAIVLAACGTVSGGGAQLENTVYDSHRRIVKLDQQLEGSVTKLNETTAELIARVNQSDQQVRTLQSIIEENQVKIDRLQKTLDNLAVTIHRSLNLSLPDTGRVPVGGPSEVEVEGVRVSPPPGPAGLPPSAAAVPGVTAPGTPTPSVPAGDPETDYQIAQKSYANEDYALALEQFGAYLQRYPNTDLCANAQFWKGYSYFKIEKYEEAIAEFERLRTNYPDSTKVPFGMHIQAMAHKALGQTARAVALLKEVVENYPMTPAADSSKTELENLGNS